MNKKLIILQLNEVNFDLVKKYISKGYLKNFKFLLENNNFIETKSEEKYENLEPWIQWVSFYSGKSFSEHKVFRLNENVNNKWSFYDDLEKKYKKKLALLFPMNLENTFTNDTFFIPDPWTETKINADFLSKKIFFIFKKIILNNSSNKIAFYDLLIIFIFAIFKTSIKFKLFILKNIKKIIKFKFFKAIIFDRLCWELYNSSSKVKNADVSSLFLNACAHIQHHYFLSSIQEDLTNKNPKWYISNIDPVLECLKTYDDILDELISLNNSEFIIATGLSQSAIKIPIFYYNLKNPKLFLNNIGVYFSKMIKRMSRDYTLEFDTEEKTINSYNILKNLNLNSTKFFNLQIKDKKIFLELCYEKEIKSDDILNISEGNSIMIKNKLNFVAIKNSIHNAKGYLLSSIKEFDRTMNIKDINKIILKQYEK